MKDSLGRNIDYMRISVTDRCNLRCVYCMPEGIDLKPMESLLTYEEIVKVCEIAAQLGITKIRLTGGEPLVRIGFTDLVGMINDIPAIEQVNMTTNGVLLKENLEALKKAGLHGINISLDTLDPKRYEQITGKDMILKVRESINEAVDMGFNVKVNAVLFDEDSYKDIILLAKESDVDVRFIELMPIGQGKSLKGVSFGDAYEYLRSKYPDIERDDTVKGNGPAEYYKIPGFKGGVGFISPIHGKFCGSCNRIRMNAEGEIKPCLCYSESFDIRKPLREGDLSRVKDIIIQSVNSKPQGHCFDTPEKISESKRMISIGG